MLAQLGGYYSQRVARATVINALFGAGEQGALYDPSDLTTLFQDSAGTTPVTADSQPVGRMLDVSGNANHATQSTAAARPLYRTDGTLHWLEFDGVDDVLLTGVTGNNIPYGGGVTVVAGATWITVSALCQMGVNTGNLGNAYSDQWQIGVRGSTQAPRVRADNLSPNLIDGTLPALDGTTGVYTYNWRHDNGTSRVRGWRHADKATFDSGNVATNWPDNFPQAEAFIIGGRSTGDSFVAAQFVPIVIRIARSTDEERRLAEKFVRQHL